MFNKIALSLYIDINAKSNVLFAVATHKNTFQFTLFSTCFPAPTPALTALVPWDFRHVVQNFTYHAKCLIHTVSFLPSLVKII